jgi:hypothetical protein
LQLVLDFLQSLVAPFFLYQLPPTSFDETFKFSALIAESLDFGSESFNAVGKRNRESRGHLNRVTKNSFRHIAVPGDNASPATAATLAFTGCQ